MHVPIPAATDPCPCPSGRRFGDCHGESVTDDDVRRSTVLNAIDERLTDDIKAFRPGRFHPNLPSRRHRRLHVGFDSPSYVFYALKSAVLDDTDAQGRTCVEHFLEHEREKLAPAARALLEAQGRARNGIWIVERVVADVGVELSDMRTGERTFVHETRLCKKLRGTEGAALLARIVDIGGIAIASCWHADPLAATLAAGILARGALGSCALGELWEQAIEKATRPTDEDLVHGQTVEPALDRYVFELVDSDDVLEALPGIPGLRVGEREHRLSPLLFLNPADPDAGVHGFEGLGAVGLTEMVVETTSRVDAEAVRARIEKACGRYVRRIGPTRIRDDDYFDRLAALTGLVGPEWSERAGWDAGAVGDIKGTIMERWRTRPHVLMFGRTPAEARETVRGRCRLRWLLDRLAALESRGPAAGRFDVEMYRVSLGVDQGEAVDGIS